MGGSGGYGGMGREKSQDVEKTKVERVEHDRYLFC